MTQVVTVHTDFTDLNQMAQGLVGRVDPVKVILPGPDPVDAGEWVQFAITLQDGTPGFAGVGRCVTAVDNGEERSSHQRFDVVIDSLQFDPRGQQVFEHILTLSGYAGDEPSEHIAAESVEEAAFEDVASEFTGSHIDVPVEALQEVDEHEEPEEEEAEEEAEDDASESTMMMESPLADAQALSFDEEVYEEPPTATHDDDEVFGNPSTGPRAGFSEAAKTAPPPTNGAQKNGAMFSYTGGLPFPAAPPRPTIDPSLRVSRAPRPKQ